MILFCSKLWANVLKEVLEYLFGEFGGAHLYFLYWFAVRSLLGRIGANAAAKVVLLAVDNQGGVEDGVDLLADEHHTHGLGHSLSDVVEGEDNIF